MLICGGRVIISKRVFDENPEIGETKLVDKLSRLLKAEIITIPTINDDYTGHADGVLSMPIRYSVIIAMKNKYWREGINLVLAEKGLQYIDFPFFSGFIRTRLIEHAIGLYVNFIEVANLIIVMPKFGVYGNKDDEAIAKMKEIFPSRIIEAIDFYDVALEGGVLNCATWTIRE